MVWFLKVLRKHNLFGKGVFTRSFLILVLIISREGFKLYII